MPHLRRVPWERRRQPELNFVRQLVTSGLLLEPVGVYRGAGIGFCALNSLVSLIYHTSANYCEVERHQIPQQLQLVDRKHALEQARISSLCYSVALNVQSLPSFKRQWGATDVSRLAVKASYR